MWPEVHPTFTVAPAAPREPDPPYSFTLDPTTVRIEGTLVISVTGVSEAFIYLGYGTGSQYLGEVELGEAGSGTLVRELWSEASVGPPRFPSEGGCTRSTARSRTSPRSTSSEATRSAASDAASN